MKRILVSLAALTLLTAAALPASAGALYTQPTDPTLSGSWQSQTANGTSTRSCSRARSTAIGSMALSNRLSREPHLISPSAADR